MRIKKKNNKTQKENKQNRGGKNFISLRKDKGKGKASGSPGREGGQKLAPTKKTGV